MPMVAARSSVISPTLFPPTLGDAVLFHARLFGGFFDDPELSAFTMERTPDLIPMRLVGADIASIQRTNVTSSRSAHHYLPC